MGDWQQVAENIVRHANGTYYLRAKVLGKIIKKSLKTKDLRVAKVKRNDLLAKERSAATTRKSGSIRTIRDAVSILRSEMVERPEVQPKTIAYAKDVIRILEDTLPLDAYGRTWSQSEATAWWSKVAKKYSGSVANKILSGAKRLAAIMIEHGVRHDNPTSGLKRMPSRKVLRKVPSREEIGQIVAHIRNQKKRECLQSSWMVAFMAFSGTRKSEAGRFRPNDIGPKVVTVGGDGNTKSKKFRFVPISAPLRSLIKEMMADRDPDDDSPFFTISDPRRALKTACKALGLPLMRVHDLRHFYATWCIQSGIDIPTVAKWLGHSDGGALAMRTYGHVRDDHSLEQVKRLV